MKEQNKKVLLKGEGTNQHTLYGDFTDLSETDLLVEDNSVLKHETPLGQFSNEHQPLQVLPGNWSLGKQVEYNPFKREITQIWD
jgi:hypothetical protein